MSNFFSDSLHYAVLISTGDMDGTKRSGNFHGSNNELMKPWSNRFQHSVNQTVLALFATMVLSVTAVPVMAATFNWAKTATGTYAWDAEPSNWTAGFPNAIADVANARISDGTGNITINLNRTLTVGTLYLGNNSNSTGRSFTINANGGSLIMDVLEGDALISKTELKSPDTINANILLNDNLVVCSSSSDSLGTLTINGIISGSGKSLTKTGSNMLQLTGVQEYDGGTTISAGTLRLGSGSGTNTTVIGKIVNNGWLGFNDANARTFAKSNYSGTGSLDKKGAGALSLTGGAWAVNGLTIGYRATGGTVTVGSGSSLSAGSGSSDHLWVGVGFHDLRGSGTLDVSAADRFSANVGTVYVGINALYPYGGGTAGFSGAISTGTLSLGVDNNITAATSIAIGGGELDGNVGFSGNNNGYVTTAANGTTTILTPYMALGTSKGTQGSFTLGTGATFNLGSIDSRSELILGRNTATAHTPSGTMTLTGGGSGVANLYLSRLTLGLANAGASPSGNMTLSDSASNNLNVSGASGTDGVVQISNNGSTGSVSSTLTIGNLGSSSAITSSDNQTAILIARKGGTGYTFGAMHLKAGTATITTSAAAIAGGGGYSALYLGETGGVTLKAGASSSDWICNLWTAQIKSAGATFDTNSNDIGISQGFSGAGALTKAGAGTLTLSGANTYTGNTLISFGTLDLAPTGSLAFVVTNSGSNKVTGSGTVTLQGAFNIDIARVTATTGSWNLVETSNMSFTSTFRVTGWTKAKKIWNYTDASANVWRFSEVTGALTLNEPGDFGRWASGFSDPALFDTNPDADPDHDGLENALEYVFGTDPRYSNLGGPRIEVSATGLVLTFSRDDASETADLELTVEISDDLLDWATSLTYTIGADTASSTTGVAVVENDDDYDTITVTLPKGIDGTMFCRLRAVVTTP